MMRKNYQKPMMQVTQWHNQTHILAGTGEPKTLSGEQSEGGGGGQQKTIWRYLN